jgi:hypothetical protein
MNEWISKKLRILIILASSLLCRNKQFNKVSIKIRDPWINRGSYLERRVTLLKTIQFPTLEDRINIHNLINHYAKGKCSRNDMMRWIAHIIGKYKVERVPIFNYSVRILQYYKDLPIISIEGAEVTDTCPGCGAGSNVSRYLRTEQENLHKDYDIISAACLDCGCVYMYNAAKILEQRQNGPLAPQSQTDRVEVNKSISQKVILLEITKK